MSVAWIRPLPNARVTGTLARLGVCALLIAATVGCSEEMFEPPATKSPEMPVMPAPELYGSLEVKAAMVGEDLDPDGFVVQLPRIVSARSSLTARSPFRRTPSSL